MALSGTSRGENGNATTSTTLVITPGSNFAVNSMGVLCVAYDNSTTGGAAGGDPFVSIVDSAGHVWLSRQEVLNDPGAAAAGTTLRIFTCYMNSNPLTTSGSITITFSPTTIAKAYALMEVAAAAGKTIQYIAGADGGDTTAATASPTITTSSITTGDMVIGAVSLEAGTSQTVTDDTDSSNGSWSAGQYFEVGTTTGGQVIHSQRKVVTGTGTQTYNPTFGIASDTCIAWIQLREVPLGTGFFGF